MGKWHHVAGPTDLDPLRLLSLDETPLYGYGGAVFRLTAEAIPRTGQAAHLGLRLEVHMREQAREVDGPTERMTDAVDEHDILLPGMPTPTIHDFDEACRSAGRDLVRDLFDRVAAKVDERNVASAQ